MEHTLLEWKWSNGEKPKRSTKTDKINIVNDVENNIELKALTDFDNHTMGSFSQDGFIHKLNKLGGQNEKLSNRHMIVQKGINPFVDTSNYIDHLDMETTFLRPKDSNSKEKQH